MFFPLFIKLSIIRIRFLDASQAQKEILGETCAFEIILFGNITPFTFAVTFQVLVKGIDREATLFLQVLDQLVTPVVKANGGHKLK